MAIQFDGATFDTVQELLEYKKALGISSDPAPAKKAEPAPTKVKGAYVFSSEEDALILKYYKKYTANKSITQRGLRLLARRLKRPNTIISQRAHHLLKQKPKDEAKKKKAEKKVKVDEMKRKHAKVPSTFDDRCTKIAKKALVKKPQIKMKDLEFPKVFPLENASIPFLEKLIINAIGNRGSISLRDVEQCLQLVNDYEWNGKTWRMFCEQLILNKKRICQAIGQKESVIRVQKEGAFHMIRCG